MITAHAVREGWVSIILSVALVAILARQIRCGKFFTKRWPVGVKAYSRNSAPYAYGIGVFLTGCAALGFLCFGLTKLL